MPTLLALVIAAASSAAGAAAPASNASKAPLGAVTAAPIDINRASAVHLQSLPGVGPAEAARIVTGRPYLSKADLASKGILPTGIYLSIKNRIIALQAGRPGATAGHR